MHRNANERTAATCLASATELENPLA
ncbi:hypothetical protein A2U01_0070436, partial [Trifolium medium]|nr:hypothetical protein [Trifolium medium]